MKNLIEILTEEQLDWFDQILLEHISINFPLNLMMCEARGLYKGLEELVEKIYSDAIKASKKCSGIINLEYDRDELQKISNIFFNRLYINIDFRKSNKSSEGFYQNNFNINSDTMLFDEVKIELNTNGFKDIQKLLYHELTHAHQNYRQILNRDSNKTLQYMLNGFYSVAVKASDDNIRQYVRDILYSTFGSEQNAFMTELACELKSYKHIIKNTKDALDVLKNTNIYNSYKSLFCYIELYNENKLSKTIKETIVDEYNNICNTNLNTNKVFKKLEYLLNKSFKKLNDNIGRLCLENLNIQVFIR